MAAPQSILFRLPDKDSEGLPLVVPPRARNGANWFLKLCGANERWRFEQTAEGEIIVIAPPGGEGSYQEFETLTQLGVWASRDRSGRAFLSTAGFSLPNGALRFPDAAWVLRSRLAKLTREQKRSYLPLCPDFAIEMHSPTDRLPALKAKMEEYIQNGAQLGWLIDPDRRKVYVYRPGRPVEILNKPMRLSGNPELPGFVLKLAEIWNPDL